MATKVFVSFRFSDGKKLKNELESLFDEGTEILNRSEDVDRSEMSDDTIRKYLYDKIRETSVTIIILSPEAVNYRKNIWTNEYDDWLYDELRYSLQERHGNKTSGAIALYTDESEPLLREKSTHSCQVCGETKTTSTILEFENLVRKNMLNVKEKYKENLCPSLYDSDQDSYVSLVSFDEFKKNYEAYIQKAKDKRERLNEFHLIKTMHKEE